VEADPGTYARLVRNVAGLERVTTVHAAIVGTDGTVPFYPSDESIASSLRPAAGADRRVCVPGVSIETLMRRQGLGSVDLVKMDIEGAELEALRTAPLEHIGELVAELHYDLIGADEAAVRRLLEDFDLRFVPLDQPGQSLVYGVRMRH
jgi:FkbM family methyltransferase